MNIELTTTNLKKLCRICLGDGEFNIWEYKVKLPNYDVTKQDNNFKTIFDEYVPVEDQVTVHEMLQIFDKWQDFDDELHLICHICLEEFLSCYIFYRKLKKSSAQTKKLYREALELETEREYSEPEQVEYLEDIEFSESVVEENGEGSEDGELIENKLHTFYLNSQAELNADLKQFAEINISKDEVATKLHGTTNSLQNVSKEQDSIKQTQTNKMIKNPKFILTGGVTQLLTRATNKRVSTPMNSPRKRQKINTDEHKNYTATSAEKPPPFENSLIVVTQFIPTSSTAQVLMRDGGGDNKEEKLSANALCSMDYAAVEINSSNIAQNAEDEFFTNTEDYAADVRIGMGTRSVYVCKYCPQAFSASHYLIAHIRKTHVCKLCTQAFIKTADLYAHIKQEHQTHKCAICEKQLSSHSNLRAHIKRMHGIQLPAQVAILGYRPAVAEDQEAKQQVGDESEDIGEESASKISDKEINMFEYD